MPENEQQIRSLIGRWADAVHAGDMDVVLADHADDIVMFDVPPPYEGVRGIQAYRDTWPGFFRWQVRGASFEIVSLDITAGEESTSSSGGDDETSSSSAADDDTTTAGTTTGTGSTG